MPISQIVTNSIADSAVVTADIANGAVTSAKMASGAARANFGAGAVLQVIDARLTITASTSSTSLVDTGLTATITPSSTSSKILIFVSLNQMSCDNANLALFSLRRNSSLLTRNAMGGLATTYDAFAVGGGQSNNRQQNGGSLTYLDSPATTSATTYKVQFGINSSGTVYLNQWALNTDAGAVSSITLMEIAG
jgi:hypothetical protein